VFELAVTTLNNLPKGYVVYKFCHNFNCLSSA
jgi:hypothetical protein